MIVITGAAGSSEVVCMGRIMPWDGKMWDRDDFSRSDNIHNFSISISPTR